MKKLLILLVVLTMLEISLALYLTFWRENFWNAVSAKNSDAFLHQLMLFTLAALFICFVSGYSQYLVSLSAIKWREQLNDRAFAVRESRTENIAQRIQEDCRDYPALALDLLFNTFKSAIYIVVFSTSLLMTFSCYLLILLFVYAIIGTLITRCIAMPLIGLNYKSQMCEATYRADINIINFSNCISVLLGLARKQKHLSYFQNLYSQVGVILPLIIIAPTYFATGMPIGTLMRFNSTGATILDNLSYGIASFASINKFLSCKKRLKEIGVV